MAGTSLIQVTQGRGQPQALHSSPGGLREPLSRAGGSQHGPAPQKQEGFGRVMRCCPRSGREGEIKVDLQLMGPRGQSLESRTAVGQLWDTHPPLQTLLTLQLSQRFRACPRA